MTSEDLKAMVAQIEREIQRRLNARPLGYRGGMRPLLQRVHCADGFSVSIQTSEGSYCTPRDNVGPWIEAELGFPSAPMPELAKWMDGPEEDAHTATQTVWGYVPIHRIAEVLASHGGLLPEGAAPKATTP